MSDTDSQEPTFSSLDKPIELLGHVLRSEGIRISLDNKHSNALFFEDLPIASYSIEEIEPSQWNNRKSVIAIPKPKNNKNAIFDENPLAGRLQALRNSDAYQKSSRIFYSCTLGKLQDINMTNAQPVVVFNPISTDLLAIEDACETDPKMLSEWITLQYLLTALSVKELNPNLSVFVNMCGNYGTDSTAFRYPKNIIFKPGHFVFPTNNSQYSNSAYDSDFIEQIDRHFGRLSPTYVEAMNSIYSQGRGGHYKLIPNLTIDEHLGPLYEVII